MSKYNYIRAITDDVKDWIMNETDIPETGLQEGKDDDFCNWAEEEMWDDDTITGNGEDFYGTEEFCSKCLSENFDLLYEALHGYGSLQDDIVSYYERKSLARYFDCMIRCHLLLDCIYKAVEELVAEGEIEYLTDN